MSTQIVSFDFGNHQVRHVIIDGDVWFVARDSATALGYADGTNAVKQHCRGVAKYHPIVDSLGRTQKARVIGEPDLMRLIVSSQLPEAQKFERIVFEDILPSIRKTGSYSMQASIAPAPLPLKERASILRTLRTSLHPDYADAKARILLAQAMGEEPEIDPSRRPLDVHGYLEELGLDKKTIKSKAPHFGRAVAKAYRERFGEAPLMVDREVNGSIRKVKGYTEQHRPIFDTVFNAIINTGPAALDDGSFPELRAL